MPSRSSRPSRYDDDPYTFDDPYMKSSPPTNAYEYVGTEDPPSYPQSPRRAPSKRESRNPSPHRSSRRYDDSPPRHHRHSSSPPRKSHHHHGHKHSSSDHGHSRGSPDHGHSRGSPDNGRAAQTRKQKYQDKYRELAQRPDVQKAQAAGRKGLHFLGDAAEAYMASQSPHIYERGVQITDQQLAAVNITRHQFHGDWNYTVSPTLIQS